MVGPRPDQEILPLTENAFMKAPMKQVIESAIAEFIDRTSNAALAVGVCAVCAQELNNTLADPTWIEPHTKSPSLTTR